MDEGDSSDVPTVFFSKNNAEQPNEEASQPKETDDLFEEQLDSAL